MSAMKYCDNCGTKLEDGAKACPECGKVFQPAKTKFCQHCGKPIDKECVICPVCGKQVAEIKAEQPSIVINNTNQNTNRNINKNIRVGSGRPKNKWVAFFLCLFLGFLGAHRFYEGRIGTGLIWLCTFGLFGIGWFLDLLALLFKPNPYYVR